MTAVVIGASRGIGKGIALALASAGTNLVIHATEEANLEECRQEIENMGGHVKCVAGDMADPATADKLVLAAMDTWKTIDIIVNCAGMNWDGMLHKMTDEQWRRVVDVNLSGAFYLMSRASREMRKAGWGRIINISSVAWVGNPGQSNYAASKAGLVALTKTAALELGAYHITCNAVAPGVIETDMIRGMPREALAGMLSRIPAGQMGQPEDIGSLVVFLCSEQAGYINGEVIGVNGGLIL